MSDPLFEVDESGEELTRADTVATTELSLAEKAATREEHVRLAEGALVRADDLIAGYLPGVNILRGCDFYLQDGELVGIIGPNGAGKSTLLKALFGLIPVRSGAVSLRGEDITSAPAHRLVSLGVGYVPQNNNVFPSLTIEENMQMGVWLRSKTFQDRFEATRTEEGSVMATTLAYVISDLRTSRRAAILEEFRTSDQIMDLFKKGVEELGVTIRGL